MALNMNEDNLETFTTGADDIVAPDGMVNIDAGAGNDSIRVSDDLSGDVLNGGDGYDQLYLRGSVTNIDLNGADLFSLEEIVIRTQDHASGAALSRSVTLSDEIFDGVSWRPQINVQDTMGVALDGTGMSSARELNLMLNTGDSTVSLGGTQDFIRVGAGDDTINAGGGFDRLEFDLGDYAVASIAGQVLSLVSNDAAAVPTWDVFLPMKKYSPSVSQTPRSRSSEWLMRGTWQRSIVGSNSATN